MEAITTGTAPTQDLIELDFVESSITVPAYGVFVPCDGKHNVDEGVRSYGFFLKDDELLSYCYHHTTEYEAKLQTLGWDFTDYRPELEKES